MPERVPPSKVTTPVVREVPTELIDTILKDLASRLGVPLEEIEVVGAGRMEVSLAAPCGVTTKIDETSPLGGGLRPGQEILLQHGKKRYRYVVTGGLVYFYGEI